MKVEKLYIIAIDRSDASGEVKGGATQLHKRYKDNSDLIILDDTMLPYASRWLERIKEEGTRLEIATKTAATENVGLYVVSHGAMTAASSLGGDQIADIIIGLGFKHLRKLNLAVCSTTPKGNNPLSDYSIIKKMCLKLADAGMTPMVAGYNGFVGIAYPGLPKGLKSDDKKDLPREQKESAKEGAKKIHSQWMYGLFNEQVRSEVKRVYKYQNGEVKEITLAEWTDKSK